MILDNGIIRAEIDLHGAELKSVVKNGREYMWCGDAKYWGRTSPVLFPFVGGLNGKTYRTGGREYTMGQHGFARDLDFELVANEDNTAVFALKSNDETLKKYPFEFTLLIAYTLDEDKITVEWTVVNDNEFDMPFSIGAHPAFNLSDGVNYFKFDNGEDITYRLIDENGLLVPDKQYTLKNDGCVEITSEMFDNDALIIENNQATSVLLCDSSKEPYVEVNFTAPLFGLWSPAGKNAPFVCIEPWYGRCDRNDFSGDLSEREYGNIIAPETAFTASYEMTFI